MVLRILSVLYPGAQDEPEEGYLGRFLQLSDFQGGSLHLSVVGGVEEDAVAIGGVI